MRNLISWIRLRWAEKNSFLSSGLALLPVCVLLGAAAPNEGRVPGGSVEGGIIGGTVGFFLAGWMISRLIAFFRKRDAYLSFRGEFPLMAVLALAAAIVGTEVVRLIVHQLSWKGASAAALLAAAPLAAALAAAVIPGLIAAANRFRPVAAALFSLLSGGMVAWVGANLLPLALLPNSFVLIVLFEGLVICALALLLLVYPQWAAGLGVGLIIFSLLSLIGAPLGILGGSLAFAWQPAKEMPKQKEEQESPPYVLGSS